MNIKIIKNLRISVVVGLVIVLFYIAIAPTDKYILITCIPLLVVGTLILIQFDEDLLDAFKGEN